jgi:hypothetical protein
MDFAKLAGIVTGSAFLLGLLINFGYFVSLDWDLFPLLSYKDHLEVLVFVVPLLAVPMVGAIYIRSNVVRRTLSSVLAFFGTSLVLCLLLSRNLILESHVLSDFTVSLLLGTSSGLLMAFFIVVLAMHLWDSIAPAGEVARPEGAVPTEAAPKPQSATKQGLTAWSEKTISAVCLGLMAIVLGGASGELQTLWTNFDVEIIRAAENGAQPPARRARLVRAIDAGLLLVFQDQSERLVFVRYESIKSLSASMRPATGPKGVAKVPATNE